MSDSPWISISDVDGSVVDVADIFEACLVARDVDVRRDGMAFAVVGTTLRLEPLGLGAVTTKTGVRTATIVNITEATYMPSGLFEYQHGTGAAVRGSLASAFDQWITTDLPVLLDVARTGTPSTCMIFDMTFPATADAAALRRRVVLGPVSWASADEAPEPRPHFFRRLFSRKSAAAAEADGCETHTFCPCCFSTRLMTGPLKPMLQADDTFAVRYFAARDQDGVVTADCRINGEDFSDGIEALKAYARTWPGRAFEFRKQYAIFYSPVTQPEGQA